MQLAPIIARLTTEIQELNQVTAAGSVPLAVAAVKTFPSACLLMPRGMAGKNTRINAIDHRIEDQFSVIVAVRNVRDMAGLAAAEDIDALRPLVIDALLNWVPATDYDPIEYTGHQLIHYQDGIMLWADHFITRHHVRSAL